MLASAALAELQPGKYILDYSIACLAYLLYSLSTARSASAVLAAVMAWLMTIARSTLCGRVRLTRISGRSGLPLFIRAEMAAHLAP